MRRWHSETVLMARRWKVEQAKHAAMWPGRELTPELCHCLAGIGTMRKVRPYQHQRSCDLCAPWKAAGRRRGTVRREWEAEVERGWGRG